VGIRGTKVSDRAIGTQHAGDLSKRAGMVSSFCRVSSIHYKVSMCEALEGSPCLFSGLCPGYWLFPSVHHSNTHSWGGVWIFCMGHVGLNLLNPNE